MTSHHLENKAVPVSAFDQETAYRKLALVSNLLFYLARDQLDFSRDALLGLVEVVDDVVEILKSKEGEQDG
jgi:hypothetical protein